MKPTSLPPVRHCGAGEGRSLSCQEKRAAEPVVRVVAAYFARFPWNLCEIRVETSSYG